MKARRHPAQFPFITTTYASNSRFPPTRGYYTSDNQAVPKIVVESPNTDLLYSHARQTCSVTGWSPPLARKPIPGSPSMTRSHIYMP